MSRAKRSLTKAAVVLLLGVVAFTAVIAAALLVPLPMDKLQIPPSTCVYDAEGRLMSRSWHPMTAGESLYLTKTSRQSFGHAHSI